MDLNDKQKDININMYMLDKQIDILSLKLKDLERQFKNLCESEDALMEEWERGE